MLLLRSSGGSSTNEPLELNLTTQCPSCVESAARGPLEFLTRPLQATLLGRPGCHGTARLTRPAGGGLQQDTPAVFVGLRIPVAAQTADDDN